MRSLAIIFTFLSLSLSLSGQTAAIQALNNEPEMLQINRISGDYQREQVRPANDPYRPSPGQTILQGFVGLKAQNILLEQLRARLDARALKCLSCPDGRLAQQELSLLMQQQLLIQAGLNTAFQGTRQAQDLLGISPDDERWQHETIPYGEAQTAVSLHCQRLVPTRITPTQQDAARQCVHDTPPGYIMLAQKHEIAWAACFSQHDWVTTPGARPAYEACLAAEDPLTQFCDAERKALPTSQCPQTVVHVSDIEHLRNYHDRWKRTPDNTFIQAHLLNPSLIRVTLLAPITSTHGEVRAQLENTVEGTGPNAPGRAILIPRGTQIGVRYDFVHNPGGEDALNLSLTSANLVHGAFFLGSEVLPLKSTRPLSVGNRFLAEGTSLTFHNTCGCAFNISQAEFTRALNSNPDRDTPLAPEAAAAAVTAAAPAPITGGKRTAATSTPAHTASISPSNTTRILATSSIPLVLVDPIKITAMQADSLFHARLYADVQLWDASHRNKAGVLPAGTDIYLKAYLEKVGDTLMANAIISTDHLVFNGHNIPFESSLISRRVVLSSPAAATPTYGNLRIPPRRAPTTPDRDILFPADTRLPVLNLQEIELPGPSQSNPQ